MKDALEEWIRACEGRRESFWTLERRVILELCHAIKIQETRLAELEAAVQEGA